MPDQIRKYARANAKALAAIATPYVLALVVWAVQQIGYDVAIDKVSWSKSISGLIVAAIVWATSNVEKVPAE